MVSRHVAKTIDELMARDYAVRLWRPSAESVIAEIECLGLIVRAGSVGDALNALDIRKSEYFQSQLDLDRAGDIAPCTDQQGIGPFFKRHLPFCFKTLFVAVVTATLFLSVVPGMKFQLRDFGKEAKIAGRQLPEGIWQGLEDLRQMPEERRERVAQRVRLFIEALSPVLREGKNALEEQGVIGDSQPRGQDNAVK